MTSGGDRPAFIALNEEARAIWDRNAAFWDDYMKEGNDYQKVLIGPAQERLLALEPDELVLDVACGNGNFARRMAALGARVIASDFSKVFIDRARARTVENSDRIAYRVIDATDASQLMALGERRFDAAVCTMALMDMSSIGPLLASLSKLLLPGGRFVFSVMHPCFNSPTAEMVAEQVDRDGEIVTTYSVKIADYISAYARKGLGIPGQPVPHIYFHRPVSALFGACFDAGFVLDGVEEPVFPETVPSLSPSLGAITGRYRRCWWRGCGCRPVSGPGKTPGKGARPLCTPRIWSADGHRPDGCYNWALGIWRVVR